MKKPTPKSRPLPAPPRMHGRFVERFPELGEAWDLLRKGAERAGPLDARTMRLVKLGIAIGARQQGAVHSGARKALAQGIPLEELEHVVALAASTIGLPATVAAFGWIHDEAEKGR